MKATEKMQKEGLKTKDLEEKRRKKGVRGVQAPGKEK